MDSTYDNLFKKEGRILAGVDEVGICDMAGPLVAACVVFPEIDLQKDDLRIFEVQDSKKLSEKSRKFFAEIIWQVAWAIGIGAVTPREIDYYGIPNATRLAILRSIEACRRVTTKRKVVPDFLLIDGKLPIPTTIPHKLITEGDNKSLCITSAGIIAKVYRDEEMIKLHTKYPHYDWVNNKGFPCTKQFVGLDKHGVVLDVHRIDSWPISPHSKGSPDAEERKMWRKRRQKWKHITITKENV